MWDELQMHCVKQQVIIGHVEYCESNSYLITQELSRYFSLLQVTTSLILPGR